MKEIDIIETKKRASEALERLNRFMDFDGNSRISLNDIQDMFLSVTEKMDIACSKGQEVMESIFDELVASIYTYVSICYADSYEETGSFDKLKAEMLVFDNTKKDDVVMTSLVCVISMLMSFIVTFPAKHMAHKTLDSLPLPTIDIIRKLGCNACNMLECIDSLEDKVKKMDTTIDSLNIALKSI